jgi:hypothetical protein
MSGSFLLGWAGSSLLAKHGLYPPSPTLPPQGGQGALSPNANINYEADNAPSPLAGEGRDGGNCAAATDAIQHHIKAAGTLINETGYHRRDRELQDLKQALSP